MELNETGLAGAHLIKFPKFEDDRGYFMRGFCENEFRTAGLETEFVQANLSSNHKKSTVRGMHYQCGDSAETKLVRCVHGRVYDVIIDMREESSTFLKWFGAELSACNGYAMYVPVGFAHGYQALTDHSVLHYMVSSTYNPNAERGVAYDEPLVNIKWPLEVTGVSAKDLNWPRISKSK